MAPISTTDQSPAASATVASPQEVARAARVRCRQQHREIALAAHYLPAEARLAADVVACVWLQLHQIMHEPAGEGGGCSSGGGGCDSCTSDLQKRVEVCRSILDYLYRGEVTGQPELDAFAAIAQRTALPRDLWEQTLVGWSQLLTRPRIATWNSLRPLLQQAGGQAALMGAAIAGQLPTQSDSGALRDQLINWGAGVALLEQVRSLPAHWQHRRLLLPLDDLVQCSLREADLVRFEEAGTSGGDERWRQLVNLQLDRADKLIAGGWRGAAAAAPASWRKAIAVLVSAQLKVIEQLQRNPDVWARTEPPAGFWHWLTVVRGAGRLLART